MKEITVRTDYTVFGCGCGVTYALPVGFVNQLRESHKTFYCPNGCARHFPAQTEEEKLKSRLTELQNSFESANERTTYWFNKAEAQKRSKAAHKAHNTILRKKLQKGLCPCCNRRFPDLQKHITVEHPDFNKQLKVKTRKPKNK